MPSTQTLLLGAHASAVRDEVGRLEEQQCIPRLWNQDASLWSSDREVQASIKKRLGWLTIAGVMREKTAELRRVAQEMREAGMTRVLLLGMGGSGLFAEVCRQIFGAAPGHLDLTVLDTTDPTAIRLHARQGPLERLCVIVSSKSGSTSEISALSKYFYAAFASTGDPGAHCIAITDAATTLEAQAKELNFRRLFVHGRGTGAEVGGRFSALTYFGLVPAALMGVDLDKLLGRAEEMFARCGPAAAAQDNPALQLGAALGALGSAGKDKLTLLCAPALSSVGTWLEQLIAENLGKMGRGIAPIHGEPVLDLAAYGSDRLFVELQLATHVDQDLERLADALSKAGHPVVRVRWSDRYDVGQEVAKWFVASAVAGCVMTINPFDEPNVKESKDRTKVLLERYARERRLPDEEPPVLAEGAVALYGAAGSLSGGSLVECLSAFFQSARPAEYVALLSFLPRTAGLDAAMRGLRERLAKRLKQATMLGFGPRYLHSTGQLYKGGPDGGLFLLFTSEEPDDLPVPGEPFTFGVLKRAQALGDFQAMQQRGRRILRVHLRREFERTLQSFVRAADEAAASFVRR